MKWILILTILFFPSIASASIIINELMYNPIGDDSNREWIELYNQGNQTENITKWKLYEDETNHRLTLKQGENYIISPNEYFVIVQDIDNFLKDYPSYKEKIIDSSFLLNNDGELIIIAKSDEKTFDSISDLFYYYSELGGNSNGLSLCKIDYSWKECIPTPGNENLATVDYFKLKITEFLPDPKGYDDAEMPEGEWIELYNFGDSPLDIESLILNDNYGNGIEISNINILQNNTLIQPKSYLTVYRNKNGKLELNNEGFEKINLFYENILLDELSYSHTKEDLSWSNVNDKWILTIPSPNEENHIEEPDYTSSLKIENVYYGNDKKAAFGDSLRVRIFVYKGDTSKYNLDLYLVDNDNNQLSKRSEINIENKFTNYTMIIPLQIEPNCNVKYPDGTYKIILKGLDEVDSKEIEIKGITQSLCETITVEQKSSSEKVTSNIGQSSKEIEQENYAQPLTSSVIYQSSDLKAKNIGIYFFCATLLLLIIYLIFKKSL